LNTLITVQFREVKIYDTSYNNKYDIGMSICEERNVKTSKRGQWKVVNENPGKSFRLESDCESLGEDVACRMVRSRSRMTRCEQTDRAGGEQKMIWRGTVV
jgi:hypothetical protein